MKILFVYGDDLVVKKWEKLKKSVKDMYEKALQQNDCAIEFSDGCFVEISGR